MNNGPVKCFKTQAAAFTACLMLLCSLARADGKAGDERIRAAFLRVQSIAESVEKIRGLKFTNSVEVAIQPMQDLKSYIEKEITEQFGEQNPSHYVEALVRLGALQEPLDLKEWFYSFMKDQAAAHYSPEQKTYYLIQTNLNSTMLDVITSHELCHALQDHNFDLQNFMKGDLQLMRDNGDLLLARQSLVEGEATWVMTAWMLMDQLGRTSIPSVEPMVSMAIKAQAAMDFDAIAELSLKNSGGMGAGHGMQGMPEVNLKDQPRFFVQQILGAYIQGASAIDYVKSQGGWEAVSDLYGKNPIESTEQLLHPEKLIAKTREGPVTVRIHGLEQRVPAGWKLVEQDVVGEMSMGFLFDLWNEGEVGGLDPSSVAEGWGGDRYFYFVDEKSGSGMLVWKTVWDSDSEAAEFAAGYRMMLGKRFPDMEPLKKGKGKSGFLCQVWETEKGRFLKLARKGQVVGIVDADQEEMLELIWE